MGGNCFHYVSCSKKKINKEITLEYSKIYEKLQVHVEKWWKNLESKNGWVMDVNEKGIYIIDPIVEVEIIIPKELDDSLTIGWQHRRYGRVRDPKEQLAEELISILFEKFVLRDYFDEIEVDEIAQDLGLNDNDYQRFTPYSGMYMTGNGESVYCNEGEYEDYTACDSECGYCGRCPY
jgi:hypothetical protein